MKKNLILFLSLYSVIASSQNYYEKFKKSWKEKDTDKTESIIKEWESKDENDPNLYIAAFNFYFSESKKEILALDTNPGKGQQFELKDSLNNTAGYIHSTELKNDSLFYVSQKYLERAINKFPNRLDLRFGKIYALGDFKKLDTFTEEILKTLEYSLSINHKWLWKDDKPLEDEIIFLKSSIQDYQNTLFKSQDSKNIKKLSSRMNEIFPNDEIILSTLGASYLLEEDYTKALEIFLKAHNINTEDTIILNNISYAYSKLNDFKNAKKYYKLMYEKGDEETKKIALEKLNQLK